MFVVSMYQTLVTISLTCKSGGGGGGGLGERHLPLKYCSEEECCKKGFAF